MKRTRWSMSVRHLACASDLATQHVGAKSPLRVRTNFPRSDRTLIPIQKKSSLSFGRSNGDGGKPVTPFARRRELVIVSLIGPNHMIHREICAANLILARVFGLDYPIGLSVRLAKESLTEPELLRWEVKPAA